MHRPLVLAVLASLVAAAPAAAQQPADVLTQIAREQSCRTLAASTVGLPDEARLDPVAPLPAAWPVAAAGMLPARVDLRTQTTSFNRLWEFALHGGELYARARASTDPWRELPLPPCIDGRLASISVDDDELIALDVARRVYTMDHALSDAALWNWSSRWGTPTWLGPGYTLPSSVLAWSWTVVSSVEDGTVTDPAGNRTAVGFGKVSHIWGLRDGGQRLTLWDPWLPLDESYEMCGPHRGRFRAVNLSASGSHIFVIGAHGDLFTRLYDFDLSGYDPIFLKYSYEDQRGKGDGAPIQLPAEGWRAQPKIPGAITSAISISKYGTGAIHGALRVEGMRDGRTGYWERDLAADPSVPWTFVPTGLTLSRPLLDNPPGDTSLLDLGPSEDGRYVMHGATSGELADYNVACSPARLHVTDAAGHAQELILHSVDGLRQQPRARGLDDIPREQNGAIEGPPGHFQTVTLQATRDAIVIPERGWRFERSADTPLSARTCLPREAAVTRRGIGPVTLAAAGADLLTALPAPRRVGRGWRWCVDGGGQVRVARSAAGRVTLVASTAPAHRARGVRPGRRVAALRRSFPSAAPVVGATRVLRLTRGGTRFAVLDARGRVTALVTTTRATAARPARLAAGLAAVGLRPRR